MEASEPSLELLRDLAACRGVAPTDDDLERVLGFLRVLAPALEELDELLSLEAPP